MVRRNRAERCECCNRAIRRERCERVVTTEQAETLNLINPAERNLREVDLRIDWRALRRVPCDKTVTMVAGNRSGIANATVTTLACDRVFHRGVGVPATALSSSRRWRGFLFVMRVWG